MRVTWQTKWPQWALLAGMVVLAGWSWPTAPNRIPMHWAKTGQPDRYGGKVEGLLLLPLVALLVYPLLVLLPRLDPGRANYAQFRGAYAVIRLATIAILAAVYVVIVAAAHGQHPHLALVILLLMGVLLLLVGSVLGKVRPNWFVGIRTPWTLSSKRAWTRTHQLAGRLFILLGLFLIGAGLRTPAHAHVLPLLVGAVGASLLVLVVYSYLVWRADPEKIPPVGTEPAERRRM